MKRAALVGVGLVISNSVGALVELAPVRLEEFTIFKILPVDPTEAVDEVRALPNMLSLVV